MATTVSSDCPTIDRNSSPRKKSKFESFSPKINFDPLCNIWPFGFWLDDTFRPFDTLCLWKNQPRFSAYFFVDEFRPIVPIPLVHFNSQ